MSGSKIDCLYCFFVFKTIKIKKATNKLYNTGN